MPQSPVTATLSDEDDGFMDLLDGENLKNDEETPSCMASLWTAPLVTKRTANLVSESSVSGQLRVVESLGSRPYLSIAEMHCSAKHLGT